MKYVIPLKLLAVLNCPLLRASKNKAFHYQKKEIQLKLIQFHSTFLLFISIKSFINTANKDVNKFPLNLLQFFNITKKSYQLIYLLFQLFVFVFFLNYEYFYFIFLLISKMCNNCFFLWGIFWGFGDNFHQENLWNYINLLIL